MLSSYGLASVGDRDICTLPRLRRSVLLFPPLIQPARQPGSSAGSAPAERGPLSGVSISYAQLRSDLLKTSDIDATSSSLPNTSSVNGVSTFDISAAQERLFGLLPAVNNTGSDDGQIGMGMNFTGNVLIAGALHEFTHALGRIDGGWSMDVFRFSSAGNRDFDS